MNTYNLENITRTQLDNYQNLLLLLSFHYYWKQKSGTRKTVNYFFAKNNFVIDPYPKPSFIDKERTPRNY